jgi:hypothetical protein
MRLINYASRIAALVMLASFPVRAQQAGGAITASGHVSAIAAVSAKSGARVIKGDALVSVEAAGARELVLSLSGRHGGEAQIEIPIQLRSNADFALNASWTTKGATLTALSVVGMGGAGEFVLQGAAGRVEVPKRLDGRPGRHTPDGVEPAMSSPATVLTGPPISAAGALDSPNNMIKVVLHIVLIAPGLNQGWDAKVKLSTAPRFEEAVHAPTNLSCSELNR